jgi:hypothetical protein
MLLSVEEQPQRSATSTQKGRGRPRKVSLRLAKRVGAEHYLDALAFHDGKFGIGKGVEIDGGMLDGTGAILQEMHAFEHFGDIGETTNKLALGLEHTV